MQDAYPVGVAKQAMGILDRQIILATSQYRTSTAYVCTFTALPGWDLHET